MDLRNKTELEKSAVSIKLEKTLRKHYGNVYKMLYFEKPLNVLVSCSGDKTINLWNMDMKRKNNLVSRIKKHSKYVYHLIKWDEMNFLSSSCDCTVRSFKLIDNQPFYKLKKTFNLFSNFVVQMVKLDDDHFIANHGFGNSYRSYEHILSIISYSKCCIIRKMENLKSYSLYTKLLLSQNYSNCLYMNESIEPIGRSSKKEWGISLINYKTNERVGTKRILFPKNTRSMETFLNEDHEEIVIFGADGGNIYIYNFHKEINRAPEKCGVICLIEKEIEYILSLLIVEKRYLFVGTGKGGVRIFDMKPIMSRGNQISKESQEIIFLEIASAPLHTSWIWDFALLKKKKRKKRTKLSVKMVSCGSEGKLCVFNVKGLEIVNVKDEVAKKDLKERVSYLFDFARFLNVPCFDIQLEHKRIENVMKSSCVV